MPELLIITHDNAENIDRRIVNEALIFRDRGWTVTAALTTSHSEPLTGLLENFIRFRATPVSRLDPVHDPVWENMRHLPDRRFDNEDLAPPHVAEVLKHVRGMNEWYPLAFTNSMMRISWDLNPDVIMACDLPALPAAHKLATWLGVPLWYDAHEFYTGQLHYSPRMVATMVHHEARCLKDVDRFFTVNHACAELYKDFYRLPKSPDVLFNVPAFQNGRSADPARVRKHLSLAPQEKVMLYHGGLPKLLRNIERLMRGFAQVDPQDWVLVLLGYGDMEHMRSVASNLVPGMRRSRIIVHDKVPQDEVLDWVAGSHLLAAPYENSCLNHRICSPNKLSDAIEIGTPMVASSNLVEMRRILTTHGIGYVGNMLDDTSMATTLEGSIAWRARMGDISRGFEEARRLYGWAHQAKVLDGWIEEVETLIADRTLPPVLEVQ